MFHRLALDSILAKYHRHRLLHGRRDYPGLISLNDSSYSAKRWQGTLLIFASVIGIALFNVFAAKRLPLAESIFVTCHFLTFSPVIITLLVLADKQPASAVFTGFTDNGAGWPSISLAVMVGQVSTMFVVLGACAVNPLTLMLRFQLLCHSRD